VTVLVLRALGLGDLLTAVPALRALRAAYPGYRVVLAVPAPLRDLVVLTGSVDELLPTAALGPLGWSGDPPAVAVNLHGRGPQSTQALRALAPERLITHGPPGPSWNPDLHEVHRWCLLLEHAGIPADPAHLALARPDVASPAPGAVVVHPGAAQPAKRWPVERYAAVARRLAEAGHRVVVTGSAAERELAVSVAAGAGLASDRVLAGRTGLVELAALVADAALVVSADTGTAHLATAYATPSVVLFGPVSPQRWGPPPERAQHVALWAGRTGDAFARTPDPGLLELTVDDAVGAAASLLPAGPFPAARRRPPRTPRRAHR